MLPMKPWGISRPSGHPVLNSAGEVERKLFANRMYITRQKRDDALLSSGKANAEKLRPAGAQEVPGFLV